MSSHTDHCLFSYATLGLPFTTGIFHSQSTLSLSDAHKYVLRDDTFFLERSWKLITIYDVIIAYGAHETC